MNWLFYVDTRSRIKQGDVGGNPGSAKHGNKEGCLVPAVAVVTLENLGGCLRLEGSLTKLDAGLRGEGGKRWPG